jgi:hypothetical protein
MSNYDIFEAIWPVILLLISMYVIAPVLARKSYKYAALMIISVFAASTIFLFFYKEMPVAEALLRSIVIALIQMVTAFFYAHLFRRFFDAL